MSYIDILSQSAKASGNMVCMGLDPVVDALPFGDKSPAERIVKYFSELLNAMKKEGLTPSAFKPNIGYYTALDRPLKKDFSGTSALADVINLLKSLYPNIPIILDSKRGDIATSSLNYAKEAFDCFEADATTVSPYMGTDSVTPFAFAAKGYYILARTSNKGGADIQNILASDGSPIYIKVAEKIVSWASEHEGIGAVVGATNLSELEKISSFFSDKEIPLLIPGVGSQGGSAGDVISILKKVSYPLHLVRINSSSGLTHPWKKAPVPDDYLSRSLSSIKKLISEASF